MKRAELGGQKLLLKLAVAEWKARDQSSFGGFMMTLFGPLLTWLVIYSFLGDAFARYQPNFGLYLFVGIVLWGFFSRATAAGMSAPMVRRAWLRSMHVPFWAVVLAPVAAVFASFCLESLLVIGLAIYTVGLQSLPGVAAYSAAAVLMLLVASGTSLILATINVFVRDTAYLWGIVTRIAFFATPVFYPEQFIGSRAHWLQANPLTHVLSLARSGAQLQQPPSIWALGYSVLFTLVLTSVGISLARAVRRRAAELL